MKDNDPCFRCRLPDCDDRSPRCELRRAANSYDYKHRRGEAHTVTAEEREANNRVFRIWQLDRLADAADGIRPYRRKGSPWTGEAAGR